MTSPSLVPGPPSPISPARLDFIDVFRGVAILAVVAIHGTGGFLSQARAGSDAWFALAVLNRICQFAVPGFLMVSAMVNGASLVRTADLKRYYLGRAQAVVWPYLVWSAIYIVYQSHTTPGWYHPSDLPRLILWGKAFTHLYFLPVLIQVLLVLPLLLPILRRRPSGFTVALCGCLVAALVYVTNRWGHRLTYPGSTLWWYVPAIAAGLWLAGRRNEWKRALRRGTAPAVVLTMAGAALYLPVAILDLAHQPVDTVVYQAGEWGYTASAALLVLCAASRWTGTRWLGRVLALLGRNSLQIYLLHPLLLTEFVRRYQPQQHVGVLASVPIYVAVAVLVPLLFAVILRRLRISWLVFGR